ncbi:MAG TPA: hypothetical protein VH301_01450 [Usitatibacter sp.]|jgi:hypothetical protein|nr:hypothetical protein [Usitatibacter sp.]
MRLAQWAVAATLLGSMGAVAADQYELRQDVPETGSNIPRVALLWPVPVDATYAELSPAQKQAVRDDYVRLAGDDEPAYPLHGMTMVLREIAKMRTSYVPNTGVIHVAVRVDSTGRPRGVAVLTSPDEHLSRAVAFTLMHTSYKPATCAGRPCDSDYSFRYDFQRSHPSTFVVGWPPVLWSDLKLHQPGL